MRSRMGLMLVVLICGASCPRALAAEPTDARPDPDACKLLSDLDIEPLLFAGVGGVLDSRSDHPAPGFSKCSWQARPHGRPVDAPSRMLVLAFYHLADARHAQAQLDRQPHGDTRPSMAMTGAGNDALVRPAPTGVMARHGADVAVIDAAGAEVADPNQLELRYLLDALALKAAGAAVKSPPWVAPGRKTQWVPIEEGAANTAALRAWAPSPDPPGPAGALLEPLIHFVYSLAQLRFGLMVPLGPVAVLLIILGDRHAPKRRRQLLYERTQTSRLAWVPRRWPQLIGGALLAVGLLNVIFGTAVAYALVDRFGVSGAALVTGSFATASQYNRRDVVGYRVLIRTPGGRTADAQFRTDDFDVVPSNNDVIYPKPGEVFTARHLPHHPSDFVILADDGSPWVSSLACARLHAQTSEAERRADFTTSDAHCGKLWIAPTRPN